MPKELCSIMDHESSALDDVTPDDQVHFVQWPLDVLWDMLLCRSLVQGSLSVISYVCRLNSPSRKINCDLFMRIWVTTFFT